MTIVQTMESAKLFRPMFRERGLFRKVDTWATWKVFLCGLFALPMTAEQQEAWRRHTGREVFTEAFQEAYVIAGRRSGKSKIASLVATFLAAFKDWTTVLSEGETGVLAVIASDRRQARVIFSYIRSFFRMPMLKSLVISELKESIELTNHVKIEIHTCSFRATRGYTLIGVIADEVAFWESESSANPAAEVLNALRPGLATTNGLLLVISSPYSKVGPLYENFRLHFGKSDSSILVWRGTSLEMNPSLPAKVVEKALERDRAAAAAEYLAEFRDDLCGFLSIEEVERVIVPGRIQLPCISGQTYRAFCDPSGGRSDSMCLGISHGEGERAILDLLREIKSPFSPEEAVREFCQLLKAYRVHEVSGDRYSAAWVSEAFERHGVRYLPSEKNRSELYLEFLPALTSGQIELLDNERMKQQFASLQRRTTGAGRDSVDHPIGSHDDLCNCAAGSLCRVLESNASGKLGLLDFFKDVAAGKRAMPPSAEERFVTVVNNYAIAKAKAEASRKCPVCSSTNVVDLGAPGNRHCNDCAVDFDAEGNVTRRERAIAIGIDCCEYAAQVFKETGKRHAKEVAGGESRCLACGRQSGQDPREPAPRGMTFAQLNRRRFRGYMIDAPDAFRGRFGRFG